MEDRRHARRELNDNAGGGALERPRIRPMGDRPGRSRSPLPTSVRDLPPLPPAYEVALLAGLEALGLSLEPHQRAAIDAHVRLLLAWNDAINLTSVTDPAEVALRHVVDSLTAVAPLREAGVDAFVDLGSGGGFPGLPLAAALPARRVFLVESIGKKAAFLAAATGAAGLEGAVSVAAERAETLAARPRERGAWPAVTARAVATLGELVELAFPLLSPGGQLVAWKRGELADELRGAERALAALGGGRLAVRPVTVPGLAGHCLVIATRTGSVPATYPRDPRLRKREPW